MGGLTEAEMRGGGWYLETVRSRLRNQFLWVKREELKF